MGGLVIMPRAMREAKALREETRRREILEAAAQVFAREGYEGATVTQIAQAAGLSEGSLYNYFRSKEELLIQIPIQLFRPALLPLFAPPPMPEDPASVEKWLVSSVSAAVERGCAYAPFVKVFLSALPHLKLEARDQYLKLMPQAQMAEILEGFLREGIRGGLFRRDLQPAIAARTLPAMVSFFVLIKEVFGRSSPFNYDEMVSEAVKVFLYGVVSRTEARPHRTRRPSVRRA